MVVGWMLYGVLVSALLLGAGLLLEGATKRLQLPRRGVWAAMMAGSVLVPLWASRRSVESAELVEPAWTAAGGLVEPLLLDPLRVVGAVGSPWAASLDPLLLAGWVLGSLCLLGMGVTSALRLRSAKQSWRLSRPIPPRVYLADDAGPAVVGILPAVIVLPTWSTPRDRRLMLTHEVEHLSAGDPALLLAAYLLVALLPWNLPLWWQLRRLRLAVEVDCDARVLRQRADLRSYADLLLRVGARHSGLQPVVALARPASFLERRIHIMIADRHPQGWIASAGLACVAGALLLVACSTDAPTIVDDRRGGQAPEQAEEIELVEVAPIAEQEAQGAGVGVGYGSQRRSDITGAEASASDEQLEAEQRKVSQPSSPSATSAFTATDQERVYELGILDRQPELRNRREISQRMEHLYPAFLENAGVGGSVVIQFVVRSDGSVDETSVELVDGAQEVALNDISLELVKGFQFRPGIYEGVEVPVLVRMPITWQPAG